MSSNYPPGVSGGMIPGNRASDAELERLCEAVPDTCPKCKHTTAREYDADTKPSPDLGDTFPVWVRLETTRDDDLEIVCYWNDDGAEAACNTLLVTTERPA